MNLGPYELGPNDAPENGIYVGDCRDLSVAITDASIDLIFTDPPYPRKYIPLYGWLAQEAARVLKPDGFLLAYVGAYYKPQVLEHLGKHLSYFWDFVSYNSGDRPIVWVRKVLAAHKSIMAYRPNGGKGMPRFNTIDVWEGGAQDKRYHTWGQDESTARYYIDCFSKPGDVILEPFCGGGTTPAACKMLGRRWLAFDIDGAAVDVSRVRVSETQMPFPQMQHTQLGLMEGKI